MISRMHAPRRYRPAPGVDMCAEFYQTCSFADDDEEANDEVATEEATVVEGQQEQGTLEAEAAMPARINKSMMRPE